MNIEQNNKAPKDTFSFSTEKKYKKSRLFVIICYYRLGVTSVAYQQ